jgi:dTMP kinase
MSAAGRSRGLLLTFEGPEGSGKTTLIENLADRLRAAGVEPVLLREPGGTAIGERIRDILLDRASGGMCPETELLLMVASRAQLVREAIRPALAEGRIVLCDRFADASVAYQGGGRELGATAVHPLNAFALGGLLPDLTFLCLLPPEEGQARLRGRETNRLDHEELAFHRRVLAAYRALAEGGDPRFRVIDAAQPPDGMLRQVLAILSELEHALLKHL